MSLCGTDGQTTTNKQVKIELLSRWKLEAEFRNFFITHILQVQIVNAIFSTRSFDIRFHWVLTGFLKVEVKEVEQVTFPAQETFD